MANSNLKSAKTVWIITGGGGRQWRKRWFYSAIFPQVIFGLIFFGGVAMAQVIQNEEGTEILPQTHIEKGISLYQMGKFEEALSEWDLAEKSLGTQEDNPVEFAKIDMLQGEVHRKLGQYQAGTFHFERALEWAKKAEDFTVATNALDRLGAMAFEMGEREKALDILREGVKLARDHEELSSLAGLLNSVGNVLTAMERNNEALGAYTESAGLAASSRNTDLELVALINSAKAAMQEGLMQNSEQRLDVAVERLEELPNSYTKVNALTTVGLQYNELYNKEQRTDQTFPNDHIPQSGSRAGRGVTVEPGTGPQVLEEILVIPEPEITLPKVHQKGISSTRSLRQRAYQSLEKARGLAHQLGDKKGEAFAVGQLGHLYEETQQYDAALTLTRQAIALSQGGMATGSLYRWHWQTGRIQKAKNDFDQASEAYRLAINVFQPIRQEVSVAYQARTEPFRENVGRMYFELADLLLSRTKSVTDNEQKALLLKEAQKTIEEFKAAELQDYFQDDCVQPSELLTQTLDASPNTAILYPILLRDRMELIVNYPSRLEQYTVKVGERALTQQARQFRFQLQEPVNQEYFKSAQQLYDWLVRPLEADLRAEGIQTMVFVPDGALRSIPIGALSDGKIFLIEKIAVATTPGLTLTDPKPLDRENIKVLSMGITESVQGFPPLPYVEKELEALKGLYGGKRFLNEEFVLSDIEQQLKSEDYNVVHIASHGLVENKVENTFVLAYDQKITMNRLAELVGLFRFRKAPLELLTLSACETAAGDDRAALGLAGIAIKAGARSALATLWFIDDAVASDLIKEFYLQLQDPTLSKAKALQYAQVKILENPKYRHPNYWSPFLLINNWL